MKAWELIADPKRWTQGEFARNADGYGVMIHDADACCWCARGAIRKIYRDGPLAGLIINGYRERHDDLEINQNDAEGMTAAVMSERLRVVEEEVLTSRP
jgi:hypothetical protein